MSGKKTVSRWKLVASGSWLSGQEFPLYQEGTVMGRGKTCDITIPGTHLSRNHAELKVQGEKLLVKDLESANGTFLNEERITQATANPGDILRMDVYSFRIVGPYEAASTSSKPAAAPKAAPPVHLTASQSLENIRNLKKEEKDYSETQWVTKPTSVGNRTHNVPSHTKNHDISFWIAIAFGVIVVGGLVAYFLL